MTDLRRAGLPTGFNPDSSQRPRSREGSSPVARPGRRRRLPVWPSRWAPCPECSQAFLRPGVPNGAPQTGRLHCRVSSLRRGVGHRGVGRTGLPPEAPGEGPSRLPPLPAFGGPSCPWRVSALLLVLVASPARLFVTPGTLARKAPLSMGFSSQEHWHGVRFLLQGIFPTQRSDPLSSLEKTLLTG